MHLTKGQACILYSLELKEDLSPFQQSQGYKARNQVEMWIMVLESIDLQTCPRCSYHPYLLEFKNHRKYPNNRREPLSVTQGGARLLPSINYSFEMLLSLHH